jgi:hypothetical protein
VLPGRKGSMHVLVIFLPCMNPGNLYIVAVLFGNMQPCFAYILGLGIGTNKLVTSTTRLNLQQVLTVE